MKLKDVNIFEGISKSELEKFEKITQQREFKKGDILFMEGDPPENLWIIVEGEVKIFKEYASGKSAIVGLFGAGDIVASVPIIDAKPYPASCQAVTNGVAGVIKRKEALGAIIKNPAVALLFMQDLTEKMRLITSNLGSMAVQTVIRRLSRFLLALGEKMGISEKGETKIDLFLTRKDIAEYIGTSFEVAVRCLSRLQNEKVIRIKGKSISILKRDRLKEIAEGE